MNLRGMMQSCVCSLTLYVIVKNSLHLLVWTHHNTEQGSITGFLWPWWILCFSFPFFIFVPDLSARVDAVKEENLKLKSENQVLGQYIENLMSASSVFQTTDTKSKRKWGKLGKNLKSQASSWERKPTVETWRGVCFLSRPGCLL